MRSKSPIDARAPTTASPSARADAAPGASRRIRAAAASCVVAASMLASGGASAQPPNTPAPGSNASTTSQSLFYEARTLMRAGKYDQACAKLDESLRLEYGVGTEFNLADCNEKTGKIASAWNGFRSVAQVSHAQNQGAREKVAWDRANALEPRLPWLSIQMTDTQPPADLEVRCDGMLIGATSFGTPIAVDPGSHEITATASGRQPWKETITAAEGRTVELPIPTLLPVVAPKPAVAPPAAAPIAVAATAVPPVRTDAARAALVQPPAAAAFPDPIVESSSTQRTVGFVLGALGIAGLGVAAGFGLDSLAKRESAKSHCDGDLCDPRGVTLRDQAITSGNIATGAAIAGAVAVLGGGIVVLTAPRATKRESAPAVALRAVPRIGLGGGGVSFEGAFQ